MTGHVVVPRRAVMAPQGAKHDRLFAKENLPLYVFVASIPFETLGSVNNNGEGLNVTVSWVLCVVWAISCVLQKRLRLLRSDRSIVATALFIMCVVTRGMFVDSSLWPEITQLILTLVQMAVMLWLIIASARIRPAVYESVGWVYGLSCSLFAILQTVGVTASYLSVDERLSGLGENANTFAGKLVVGLVLLVGLIWNRKSTPLWIALLVVTTVPFSIFAIMSSGSRGALLSLCVGFLVLAYSKTLLQGKALSRIASLVAATVLAGTVVYSISQSTMLMTRWRRTIEMGDMATREVVYPQMLGLISQKPLLGWGPAQNYRAAAQVTGSGLPRSTENTVLWSLTALGFVGAGPFLYVLYLAVISAWRLRRTSLGWTPIAVMATTLAVANTIEWYHVKVFWLILAISIGAARNLRRKRRLGGVPPRPEVIALLPAR